jgi:hypothetical protein
VYGPTPPDTVTDADPVAPPLHNTFVCDPVDVNAGGAVIVYVCVAVQPAGEETVTV